MQERTEFRLDLQSHSQQFAAFLALALAAWLVIFWQGIVTAIDIWIISDIFNHCLFVIPGAACLIYLKRQSYNLTMLKPVWWPLVLCAGSALLYMIGVAGDVQLFMHAATFSFLPLVIWACVGNAIAKQIIFPLFFILFCIPFGEEFIPFLQKITADMAVAMLNWSGIPIFRTGLYIEIPQGRFLVAEACSGISFFIASVVIGALYSYLNIYSTKRRICFVILSIIVPIIANSVRVYGIIVIAYLTDMEYAVGADHLIYGWFFFAFVIILLLAVGELVREKHAPVTAKTQDESTIQPKVLFPALAYRRFAIGLAVFYLSIFAWLQYIHSQQIKLENPPGIHTQELQAIEVDVPVSSWVPIFNDAFDSYRATLRVAPTTLDAFVAWYPRGHGELVSSLHRFYGEKEWTLESSDSFSVNPDLALPLNVIVSAQGYRVLTSWYVVDGKVFSDKRLAKLYEIYRAMLGEHQGGLVIALSKDIELVTKAQDLTDFEQSVTNIMDKLSSSKLTE